MFRKTIAKKERGKRKDEGRRRKKKAGGKGREIRKRNENVGMEGNGRRINEKKEKEEKCMKINDFHNFRKQQSKSIEFLTLRKKNIAKVLCFETWSRDVVVFTKVIF